VLALGVLSVGSAALMFELIEAHPLVKAAWRMGLASAILAPIVLSRRRGQILAISRADWRSAALAGLALAAHFALWVPSLDYTSVASSVILVTTSPLFVGLLSPRFLGEKISNRLLHGIGLSFAGACVVILGDSSAGAGTTSSFSRAAFGDLLALGGAVAAAYYFMLGRGLRARLDLLSYVFVVYSMAAICLFASVLVVGEPLFAYPPRTWLILFAIAFVPQILGHSSFNWALQHLSAAYVSAAVLGEPIVSAALAFWVLGEAPGPALYAGGSLILVGLAVATLGESSLGSRRARFGAG
jgi:drug/metabolite transporter (DMT)-like permease